MTVAPLPQFRFWSFELAFLSNVVRIGPSRLKFVFGSHGVALLNNCFRLKSGYAGLGGNVRQGLNRASRTIRSSHMLSAAGSPLRLNSRVFLTAFRRGGM